MSARSQEPAGLIDIATTGRVLWVTLAHPPDNRLTPPMIDRLSEAIDRLASDEVDLMVLRGSSRVFSKGLDVPVLEGHRDRDALEHLVLRANHVCNRLSDASKPTIAAINGTCLGGGFELALACHLRVCVDKARLGFPEIWNDLVPGLGGFYRLAGLVGRAKALELTLLGDLITGDEALRLNLVSRRFRQESFATGLASFVTALTQSDQRVVGRLIQMARNIDTLSPDENIQQGARSFVEVAEWSRKHQS